MTYALIPLSPVATQVVTVSLSGQRTRLAINQRTTGLYIDVFVNDAPVILGVVCRDRTLIVRDAYLGFLGDLAFEDTAGTSDPSYTGLGTRFVLAYLEPA